MTTAWTRPTMANQYDEPGAPQGEEMSNIPWDSSLNFEQLYYGIGGALVTTDRLQHIARSPKYDLRNKTYFVAVSGFNFQSLPTILSGISLRLTANRRGRVTDETVQLALGSNLIGDNRAGINLDPIQVYGGSGDLWNTNLSIADVSNSNFGVVLRFQAHPFYPHRDAMYLDAVELQIY